MSDAVEGGGQDPFETGYKKGKEDERAKLRKKIEEVREQCECCGGNTMWLDEVIKQLT